MTAVAEFALILALTIQSISGFANVLDSAHLWSDVGYSWLDLLIAIAFVEITWDFLMDLAYGEG